MISWLFEQAITSNLVFPFIAPNRLQAKNIVWNDHVARLLNEFKTKGLPYVKNEVELSVSFPKLRGGKVQLLGVENEEALRGMSNWGAIACDEYDDWSSDIWPLIIRPNLMATKGKAMIAGTPKGKRNMWRMSQSQEFQEFHYTSFENPDLDKEELESMVKEYMEYGEDYFRQEIMAEYVKPAGVVYREWNEDRQFVDLSYDPNLPLHISFDWGINDPTAVIWLQPHGPETRVIDYYEASDSNIEHFISVIDSKPYRRPDLFTGDPAGKARNLITGTSVIEQLANKRIHVRTKDGVRIPDQIRSTHAIMPGLYVDTKCDRFRDCLINYRYPEIKSTAKDQSNEVPIHDQYSHAMRALEYWVVNTHSGGSATYLSQSINTRSFDWYIKKIKESRTTGLYAGRL